jgi:hypothetical protein
VNQRICTTSIAFEHLRFIEILHAAPIVDIPEHHLSRRDFVTSHWVEIQGIEALTDQAVAEGRLWSELNSPWSGRTSAAEPGEHLRRPPVPR